MNLAALPHYTAAANVIRKFNFELDRAPMPGSCAAEDIPKWLGDINGHLTDARIALLEHPDAVLSNGGFGPTLDERLAGRAFDALFLGRAYSESPYAAEAVRAGVAAISSDVRWMISSTMPLEPRPFIPSGKPPYLGGIKNPSARPGA